MIDQQVGVCYRNMFSFYLAVSKIYMQISAVAEIILGRFYCM